MTPMDYCLRGFIKSKVYVKNYEKVSDLKAAIISAFQEMSDGMITLTMENFDRQMKMVLRNRGGHFEDKS